MATEAKSRLTPEQYLAMERHSETRNQFLNGEVFAMTGASREHNLINGNLFSEIHSQLRGRSYEAYANDMRVKVSETGLYTYPDVVVVCGQPQFEDAELDTLLNPTLIAEVLSESTEVYDRGMKFTHYRTLPSFSEYVLVAQKEVHVEHFIRQSDGWLLTETGDLTAVLDLPSIGCRLSLADIYERVFAG
jgi:Uma2 family endonuclease